MTAENEVRVFGPPGTGKTTWVSASVRATAKSRATSRIIVGSFTRAAAQEIAGRGLPIDRNQIGTLHALAYRSIDHPAVADEEHLGEWNKTHPHMSLSGGFTSLDEAPTEMRGSTDGDRLLAEVDHARARMIPLERWPNVAMRRFYSAWTTWKTDRKVIDFTDMIELAIANTERAPGDPIVGFWDEVQDFTPLELTLVRHWGRHMERVVLAGDDDQCLYNFKGASPDAFLDPPLPTEQKRVLSQSWRVPRAVHAAAQYWVETLSRREPKEYQPREADGAVRKAELHHEVPDDVVADVVRQLDLVTHEEATGEVRPRTVMILATCSYMLDKIKHAMRNEGVPFHNPYRRRRGDWNPLRPGRGTSSAERLAAYLIIDERMFGELSRLWTGGDVKRWTAVVKKQGVFRRGAARSIAALPDRELSYGEVAALFESEDDVARALEPDLDWLRTHLLTANRATMEYPIRVARRRAAGLVEEPQVILGTIHSVKGGQADSVYLFPDLSMAGMREWEEVGERRDSVVRQMYVGMTRAREELIVCQPSTPMTVDPELLVRGAR